ncbi:putative cyclin-dependent kinase 8 [Colletotrichum siamense]|uniref:putative cyclin-dependent kinase 8 n=1 Tax=Colletotrichum siamense TaxID=690259 RepID=UPI0018728754|nr:putative cyclin-dependent kinase 8 [Colletotrichum siamense]KAF5505070.1 putative cyclin-dependent kinase 8 [Colletotrichum siamense]
MATVRYNHPVSSGDLIPRIDAPEYVGSEVGLHGQDHKDLHLPVIIHEDVSDLIDHQFDTSNEPADTDTSTALAAIRGQGLPRTKDLPKSTPEPSEITDHGHQRYNELKNENLVPRFPVDDDELEGNLSDLIFEASCENSQDRQEFLPKSQLDRLIHPNSVRLELKRQLPDLTEDTIRSYANRICHGRAETIEESTTEDLVKSYQKVFAVLVLVNKVNTIERFLEEGLCDADLPLQRYSRKKDADRRKLELRRKKQPGRRLDCFKSWKQVTIRHFEQYQWAVVPPFFTKGKRKNVQHYVLEPSTVLPFIFTDNASGDHQGGYSRVYEADIHPDHHNFNGSQRNEQDTSKNTFAIKRLQDSTSKEAFQKEVQILKRFSGDAHPHLISLLATFERSGIFYLIFPWAGADLKTYWESKNPRPAYNVETVIWMAEQCGGLAEGLTRLHQYETGLNDKTDSPKNEYLAPNVFLNGGKDSGRPGPLYGRHGDIKPENILWFPDPKVPGHKGTLKISDFGLSELNSRYSKSQRSQVPNSPGYRPPECDLRKKIIKQSYDIWTLGCLYLEFITWTV